MEEYPRYREDLQQRVRLLVRVYQRQRSTTAKFFACYKVNSGIDMAQDTNWVSLWRIGSKGQRGCFYDLEPVDLLKEYEGQALDRILGKATRSWRLGRQKIFFLQNFFTYKASEISGSPYESWHSAFPIWGTNEKPFS